jgi:PBSX family phage portal protein
MSAKDPKEVLYNKGFAAGIKSASKKKRSVAKLNSLVQRLADASQAELSKYSRQVSYDDDFMTLYGTHQILKPAYSPQRLYQIYEESGVLQACVEANVRNIVGFGWSIVPTNGTEFDNMDPGEKEKDPEKLFLEDFFSTPNGDQSFTTIAEKFWRDYEICGHAYLEVVKAMSDKPQLVFWADTRRLRACYLDDTLVDVSIKVRRGGKIVSIPAKKKFRKYVMLSTQAATESAVETHKLRYFKEYGDPRKMNALTGHYENQKDNSDKVWVEASEIAAHHHGNDEPYGMPRWIGCLMAVLGLNKAEFVNLDLFTNQGIPPLLITIAGGQLTEESIEDLMRMMEKAKGAESFNKTLILEAESTSYDLQGREQPPKIDFKSLLDYRQSDLMFKDYMVDTRDVVRRFGFRLAGIMLGDAQDINYASARILREIMEEQVFQPERRILDEMVNKKIVEALGIQKWKYQTVRPIITSKDELLRLVKPLIDGGCFTINELVEFANRHFGMQLRPYTGKEAEEWADIPIPVVLAPLHNYGKTGNMDSQPTAGDTTQDTPQVTPQETPQDGAVQ